VKNYIPDRGDIVWLTFNPQEGHEQRGRRPALILSPKDYNLKTSLASMCPITSKIKNYPFEVILPEKLSIKGVILSDQIKNLDWSVREAEYCCKIDNTILEDVLAKIKALLFNI